MVRKSAVALAIVFVLGSWLSLNPPDAAAQDLNLTGNLCAGSGLCVGAIPSDLTAHSLFPELLLFDDSPLAKWRFDAIGTPLRLNDDVTGTIPLQVMQGALDNSLVVGTGGNIGLGTATPARQFHLLRLNNVADLRLESSSVFGDFFTTLDQGSTGLFFINQNGSAAATATSVKFLNGAPGDTLVVAPPGRVGIGTASPGGNLHIFGASVTDVFAGMGPDVINGPGFNYGYSGSSFGEGSGFFNVRPDVAAVAPNPSLRFLTVNQQRMIITNAGLVGMGAPNPSQPLQMGSGAFVSFGGVWTNASSREFKQDIHQLTSDEARTALEQLEPVKFAYKVDPAERHVGFIAEDVPDLVATADRKTLSPMDIVAVLTRVVQEQEKAIADLTAQVAALRGTAARPSTVNPE
jgi:hypothetical protein